MKYRYMLMDTTWKGKALRRWHDRIVRLGILVSALVSGNIRARWDEIRHPNPAQYI